MSGFTGRLNEMAGPDAPEGLENRSYQVSRRRKVPRFSQQEAPGELDMEVCRIERCFSI